MTGLQKVPPHHEGWLNRKYALMNMPEAGLPNFERPPVQEVALGIQFAPIVGLHMAHVGLFWRKIRDRFPTTETHPPLDRIEEHLNGPAAPRFRLELVQNAVLPRAWFISEQRNELIQVQQDRFVLNWRKIKNEDTYPRFPYIQSQFKWAIDEFQAFLSEEKLGALKIDQCEVSYTNSIIPSDSSSSHADIAEVLAVWNPLPAGSKVADFESARFGIQYLISGQDGKDSLGRLHVDFQPAVRMGDRRSLFAMNFVARGKPIGDGVEGANRFFVRGRECIVQTFAALTTQKMHKEWGRQ